MIAAMPRNRTHPPAPDLFSEASPRDAFPAPENQIPSPKPAIEAAANSLHVLPKDLPGALKQLGDIELASLLAAALDEAKRRDKLRPGLEVTSAAMGKALPKSNQRSTARQGHSAAPSLTRGQVNAVRAAFRAGIGPSRIAREFGISKTDVHNCSGWSCSVVSRRRSRLLPSSHCAVTAQIAGRKIHVLRDKLQIGAELMKFSEVIARSATVMPLAEELLQVLASRCWAPAVAEQCACCALPAMSASAN
jgi:hypothetical protein